MALGVSFQIPSVIYVLSRLGLVSARFLLAKLQYAVFAAVVIAAVITPSPDIGNMFIIAGPMILLYTMTTIVAIALVSLAVTFLGPFGAFVAGVAIATIVEQLRARAVNAVCR